METWKPVLGFPRYEISDAGRLRTISPSTAGDLPTVLKPFVKRSGYVQYGLSANGVEKWFLAHRLVALHFLSPDPERPVVNHRNGDKADNRVDNLEWSTLAENNRHADARGVRHALTNPKRAHKLTAAIVETIRAEHKATGATKAIAEKHGLSATTVRRIVHGRSWIIPSVPSSY